jgi:predicted protein tyrosine phosphatase
MRKGLVMILFVCSQAFLRSRTAEILATMGGAIDVRSCGTDSNAQVPVNKELVMSAEVIYCMEIHHREKVRKRFSKFVRASDLDKKTKILHIEDEYDRFDPVLVDNLINSVNRYDPELALKIARGFWAYKSNLEREQNHE